MTTDDREKLEAEIKRVQSMGLDKALQESRSRSEKVIGDAVDRSSEDIADHAILGENVSEKIEEAAHYLTEDYRRLDGDEPFLDWLWSDVDHLLQFRSPPMGLDQSGKVVRRGK